MPPAALAGIFGRMGGVPEHCVCPGAHRRITGIHQRFEWELSAFLGVVYIALYLVFVVVVPVLILAAAILKVWQKIVPEKTVNE